MPPEQTIKQTREAPGRSPPLIEGTHTDWYHGSPLRLRVVSAGSTVTPVIELAKAFAHKPTQVSIEVRENDEKGHVELSVTIEHNGQRDAYLYKVLVAKPERDLHQHPGSRLACGEEMLATRDLSLEFIEELPLSRIYKWTTTSAGHVAENDPR